MKTENYKSAARLLASFARHICTTRSLPRLSLVFFCAVALPHTHPLPSFSFRSYVLAVFDVCLCMRACISVLICESKHTKYTEQRKRLNDFLIVTAGYFFSHRWLSFSLSMRSVGMKRFFSRLVICLQWNANHGAFRLVTHSFAPSTSMDCVNRI